MSHVDQALTAQGTELVSFEELLAMLDQVAQDQYVVRTVEAYERSGEQIFHRRDVSFHFAFSFDVPDNWSASVQRSVEFAREALQTAADGPVLKYRVWLDDGRSSAT